LGKSGLFPCAYVESPAMYEAALKKDLEETQARAE
jgi:hypothetical protein